jgi:hypothetical protein
MATFLKWMKNRYALGVLAIGGISGLVFWGLACDLSKSDWGTWVGSAGTVLTLVGTIYLATNETRRQHVRELRLAQLHAVYINARLLHVIARVQGIKKLLEHAASERDDRPDLLEECNRQILEIEHWGPEDALPFAAFEGNIAKAIVHLSAVLTTIRQLTKIAVQGPRTAEDLRAQASNILPVVDEAQRIALAIRIAADEIVESSNLR